MAWAPAGITELAEGAAAAYALLENIAELHTAGEQAADGPTCAECSTAFITLSTSDESRLLCDTTTDPADSGVSAQPVALISLPFPRPDQGASIANPTELLRWVTKHAHSLR